MTTSGRVIKEITEGEYARPGHQVFEFDIPNLPLGGVYKWHVQMYNSNWTKKLAENYYEETVTVMTLIGPPANNSFSDFSPPSRIIAGKIARVSYNFNKTENDGVHIQTRLLSKEGKILLQDTQSSNNNSGQISVEFNIPLNLASRTDYKWNIQMFDDDWKNKLATSTKSDITVSGAGSALKAKLPNELNDTDNQTFNDFTVSPNPFVNSFEYEYSVEDYDDVTVDLYALNGRKIKTLKSKESHRPGNYNDVVDTSDLDAGIYILRINTSEGEKAIKLIKN
ncbi:T9SS type A sorting domain-containing protein [Zobellia nedashkovskayae]|uniref:T9SS type A sorting domain-containing protein n=1 Tax=Zobellia nedashkovskayae TaxID=2779510 RepID=UPI001D05810F|nr:T9SS type A sorting domain-containing protein [Zobellia nedashkovskayae]